MACATNARMKSNIEVGHIREQAQVLPRGEEDTN
jgi:hypothetical protein